MLAVPEQGAGGCARVCDAGAAHTCKVGDNKGFHADHNILEWMVFARTSAVMFLRLLYEERMN